jgi:hypothetical protein
MAVLHRLILNATAGGGRPDTLSACLIHPISPHHHTTRCGVHLPGGILLQRGLLQPPRWAAAAHNCCHLADYPALPPIGHPHAGWWHVDWFLLTVTAYYTTT